MRGHIAKKGNRYYTVVYEGIDAATGKPRHRWHTAGETRKGTVFRNVADIADPPSISRSGRSMNVWTGNQFRTFLEAIAEHELYGLYFLAATTGMRRGEIADLRWRNIDLDEQTMAMLRRHRRHHLEDRMATGQRGDDGFVFARPDGSPVHPDLISQTFQRFMAQIDLPTIRLHDLRHNHTTILLQHNVHPKIVSERLGHSNISFTMTVYQHVMLGMQAETAATFVAAVFGE